ncbi:MAG: uroporphyrinogen-III synthase, partial [Rhodospirillales bacterium]
ALIEPLLTIEPLTGPPLDLGGVQALLATSANGVRGFAAREHRRDLPVYAVGDATARTAAAAGFAAVESAGGDVDSLAALVRRRLDPAGGALLHAAGSALAGDLGGGLRAAGFTYRRIVLYRARTADRLSPAAAAAIRDATVAGVVLFSPRTAAVFAALATAADVADGCRRLACFCLSDAVAAAAGAIGWARTVVARRPDQAALIEAVLIEAALAETDRDSSR